MEDVARVYNLIIQIIFTYLENMFYVAIRAIVGSKTELVVKGVA